MNTAIEIALEQQAAVAEEGSAVISEAAVQRPRTVASAGGLQQGRRRRGGGVKFLAHLKPGSWHKVLVCAHLAATAGCKCICLLHFNSIAAGLPVPQDGEEKEGEKGKMC